MPAPYAHLRQLTIRYARWDLSRVLLCDANTGTVLTTLYPLDKTRNAEAGRRPTGAAPAAPPPAAGMAPLLEDLVQRARATGLPPAYVPKDEDPNDEDASS